MVIDIQLEVLPTQPKQLAAPHPSDQPKVKQRVQAFTSSRIQKSSSLFWCPGFAVDFRNTWRINQFSDVAGD